MLKILCRSELWILHLPNRQWSNFDLSPPSAAYMRQWAEWALVQIMACRLFGAKLLPEPMLAYC